MLVRSPYYSLVLPCISLVLLTACLAVPGSADEPRFVAAFADGSKIEGNNLHDWHTTESMPRLDGRALLEPANPMRWLVDRALTPAPIPEAYVETTSGDRLPGEVLFHVAAGTTLYEPLPAHFAVRPAAGALRVEQSTSDDPRVRVLARFVRRIVWQRRDVDRYEPGTLFYRDGRKVAFRAARFSDDSVQLLLADGQARASFREIAELHLPQPDFWGDYFDELSVLSPQGNSLLMQVETTGGVIATTSLSRFTANVQGNPADSSRWRHGFQPAWSLDVLWVIGGDVSVRRVFSAHQVPLSRVPPSSVEQQSLLAGAAWPWQANRGVQGGVLRGGKDECGWGLGVHALCRLTYPLPPMVESFRSRVGLERSVGTGGCIRARVLQGEAKEPRSLYQSDFLVGSENTADTGNLVLEGDGGPLVLEIDPAHEGRPDGADPLDIRDSAGWFDPLLVLETDALRAELERRVWGNVAALAGWELIADNPDDATWTSILEPSQSGGGTFHMGVASRAAGFSLVRRTEIGTDDNFLVIVATRYRDGGNRPKIEIRVDGEAIVQHEVPQRFPGQAEPPPLVVPLADYQDPGRTVRLELVQLPADDAIPVVWRSVRLTPQMPTLFQVFEDAGDFAPIDPDQTGTAAVTQDDHYTGRASVKVTAKGEFRLPLAPAIEVRENPTWGQYRFVRFAFRKYGAGRVALELNHERSADRPARYDAGIGDPALDSAVRVWLQPLPAEWIVITRDLYAEFGNMNVSGLTVAVPDGEYALIDHVYLGRTQGDLDAIPAAPSATVTNDKAMRELARPVIEKATAATVALQFNDGRVATGVLISGDGDVLTAGHDLAGVDGDVVVRLPDGRALKGEIRGLVRDADVGLVRIDAGGALPFLEFNPSDDLSIDDFYVSMAHSDSFPKEGPHPPQSEVVALRRAFLTMLWVEVGMTGCSTGGPLVDRQGRLVGIHNRNSKYGGFLYSRIRDVHAQLSRLREGQRWGSWYAGTGPVLGIDITPTRRGCQVNDVLAGGPGEKAGLVTGDVITRVEGKSVVSLQDIDSIIADYDPGREIELQLSRGEETLKLKLTLGPRFP